MRFRTRSPGSVIVGLCLSGMACVPAPPASSTAKPPNVIVMLADDLGWADVGFHGGSFETPNIDRLAAEGLELERFYTWPMCTPTRAALMTGRSPMRLGLGYFVLKMWNPRGLPADERIMPESFRAAGYRTGAVGKWHLGSHAREFLPNERGFDHFYGLIGGHVDYFEHTFQGGIDWQRNGETVREEGYATDLIGNEADRWITEAAAGDEPFFLYVAFNAPHPPMQARPEDTSRYQHLADERAAVVGGMVHALDRAVGKVLTAVDRTGVADRTLVLFLSDNGATAGSGRNRPFRGGKGTTFEGGIRVPAVIRWPGRVPAEERSPQVMRPEDVLPTLLSATGIALVDDSKPLDGVDLWPSLAQSRTVPREPLFTAAETAQGLFLSVLHEDWKLVRIEAETTRSLLFRVDRDPGEGTDLAQEHPQRVRELTAVIDDWRSVYPADGVRYSAGAPEGWRRLEEWARLVESSAR